MYLIRKTTSQQIGKRIYTGIIFGYIYDYAKNERTALLQIANYVCLN